MIRICLMVLCCFIVFAPAYAQNIVDKQACFPFANERMVFDVGWEFINAGTAIMQSYRTADHGYRIDTDARTNKFLDVFKKVRDRIISEGICQGHTMQSTLFSLNQQERSYRAVKKTVFDWSHGIVHYTQHNKTDDYVVSAGHLNVMDVFFKVRSLNLKPGDRMSIPIFDSRKTYELIVVVEKKTVMMPSPWGKRVECLVVEPQLKTAGMFSSKGKIKVWMTNDSRHIPVKMTAKIKIGRIIAYLTDYRSPSL